jgi:alcohol dehydrogenase
MLSDVLPTGFECGVLSGQIAPGDTVAIVGAGAIGLAALLTAQLYSPSELIVIDTDPRRLEVAHQLGATQVVNSTDGHAVQRVLSTSAGGADVVIEAVGLAATFDLCQGLVAVGGRIANVGVHGAPVWLHLDRLWDRNVTLTTRLVDTTSTPRLLDLVQRGRLDPHRLISHRFGLDDIMMAYDLFEHAAIKGALKVVLRNDQAD